MDITVVILITLAVLLVALAVVAAVAWPRLRARRRSKALQHRFGPEYDQAVGARGDRRTAEDDLERRVEHRNQLDIRPLEPAARQRYAEQWRETQKRFVDAPSAAISEANELVSRVMRDRGYPVADFDQRAEDLSVDHPGVVQDYRAAHRVAVANKRGEASTEDLRRALVDYRSLFDRLLGDGDANGASTHTPTHRERPKEVH